MHTPKNKVALICQGFTGNLASSLQNFFDGEGITIICFTPGITMPDPLLIGMIKSLGLNVADHTPSKPADLETVKTFLAAEQSEIGENIICLLPLPQWLEIGMELKASNEFIEGLAFAVQKNAGTWEFRV